MIHVPPPRGHVPSDDEMAARRSRNRAIGVALAALVVLFYVTTMAKLGLHLPGL